MAVKYRLDFDTIHGTDIEYRLEILQTSYSGSVLPLIGTGDPVNINTVQDSDPYSPIKATILTCNLVVDADHTYEEFSAGGYKEYEVRVSRLVSPGTYTTIWNGHIISENYSEHISSYPYTIQFTATDGLGQLANLIVETQDTETPQTPLSFIQESLALTGLDLPLNVQSGIATSTDVDFLEGTAVSQYTFYNQDLTEAPNHLDRASDILRGINCRLFQADGEWWITNNSTHPTATMFKTFATDGSTSTSNKLSQKEITGINGDLVASNDSLYKNYREAFGSVECHIEPKTGTVLNYNPFFSLSGSGYQWPNAGIPQVFNTDFTRIGNRSVQTGITDQVVEDPSDAKIWFRNTNVPIFNHFTQFSISFDYMFQFIANNVNLGEVRFRIINDFADGSGGVFGNSNFAIWNFEDSIWHLSGNNQPGDSEFFEPRFIGKASSAQGEWATITTEVDTLWQLRAPDDAFRVEIFTPYALAGDAGDENIVTGTGVMNTYIDRFTIQPVLAADYEPVYEIAQLPAGNYTKEYEYNTSLTTRGEDIFYGYIDNDTLKRVGKTEELTLEEIAPLQRLNDYRQFAAFYQGQLINNSDTPMSMRTSILVDYPDTTAERCIVESMSWQLRSNIVQASFRVPNQNTDVSNQFFERDVDLIQPTFVTSGQNAFTLDFTLNILDENGASANARIVQPDPIVVRGEPGTQFPVTLVLEGASGFVPTAGTFSLGTLPSGVTSTGVFKQSGLNVVLNLTMTVQDRTEAETVTINGTSIPFVPEATPGVVAATVTVTHAIADVATPTSTVIAVNGVPGSRQTVVYQLDAGVDRIILNPDETHADTSLTDAVVTGVGTQVATFTFSYDVPTTTENVNVTVTGNSESAAAFELDGITRNLVITNNLANSTIVDGSTTGTTTTIPFSGFTGDVLFRNITVLPSSDYYITNISDPTSGVTDLALAGTIHRSGEDWEIPVNMTLTDNSDINITLGGTTVQEENAIIFNVTPYGLDNAVITTDANITQTFDSDDFGDSIQSTVITLTPASQLEFGATADVSVDVNEAMVRLADGSTVTLPESQYAATVALSTGVITVTLSGNFPSQGGLYTIDVNIVGNTQDKDATTGSFTFGAIEQIDNPSGTKGFPAYGGAFAIEVVADGKWNITTTSGNLEPRVMPNEGAGNGLSEITLSVLSAGTAQGGFTLQLRNDAGTILDTYALNQGTQYGSPKVETSSTAPMTGTNDQIITFVMP